VRYRLIRLCVCALSLAAFAGSARAHDPGMSIVTLSEHGGTLAFQLVAADSDLPAERRASSAHCDTRGVLALWLDGRPLPVAATCRAAEHAHTAFEGNVTLEGGGQLAIGLPLLHELPRGHETFVRLLDAAGKTRTQRMVADAERHPLAPVAAPAPAPAHGWLPKTLAIALLALLILALDAVLRARRKQHRLRSSS
jgi:hypothetical protein